MELVHDMNLRHMKQELVLWMCNRAAYLCGTLIVSSKLCRE